MSLDQLVAFATRSAPPPPVPVRPPPARPAAWQVDFDPPRACAACEHGREGACKRPEVQGRGQPLAFAAARAAGGACGPDARYLNINGLDYSK